MNKVLTGIIVTVVTLLILLVVSIICNKNGIDLNNTGVGTVCAIGAMLVYEGLTKKRDVK
ncbi:MAG: hypothetical protein IKS48_01930 [Eubacterium sp.]|nr:hypothetical protein [Eubacterium sp.]